MTVDPPDQAQTVNNYRETGNAPFFPDFNRRANAATLMTEMHDYFRAYPFNFTLWDTQMPFELHGLSWGVTAWGTLLDIGATAGKSSDLVYHEYTHNMIYKLYGNRFIEPVLSEKDTEAAAMDEAFADYFTAAKKNDPLLGEATPLTQRNVDNNFDMSYRDTWSGNPDRAQLRGQIISGAVWSLKDSQALWYYLGQPSNFDQVVDQGAYNALWLAPHPTTFKSYAINIIDAFDAHGQPWFDPINDAFCDRDIDTGYCGTSKAERNGPEHPGTHTEHTSAFLSSYPNPFNPATAVQVQMRERQPVRLAVYDVLGREVAVLIDGIMDAGMHTVTFDGTSFSSGVYLLYLITPFETQTQHIVLQK